MNQSTNQPNNQPTSQPTGLPTNHPIEQASNTCKRTNEHTKQTDQRCPWQTSRGGSSEEAATRFWHVAWPPNASLVGRLSWFSSAYRRIFAAGCFCTARDQTRANPMRLWLFLDDPTTLLRPVANELHAEHGSKNLPSAQGRLQQPRAHGLTGAQVACGKSFSVCHVPPGLPPKAGRSRRKLPSSQAGSLGCEPGVETAGAAILFSSKAMRAHIKVDLKSFTGASGANNLLKL